MGIIISAVIGFFAIFLMALVIDSWFYGGRFLNKTPVSPEQFKQTLESVLSQQNRPVQDWEALPQDWFNDKFRIPLRDSSLEDLRRSIAKSIEANPTAERISLHTVQTIESALSKLK